MTIPLGFTVYPTRFKLKLDFWYKCLFKTLRETILYFLGSEHLLHINLTTNQTANCFLIYRGIILIFKGFTFVRWRNKTKQYAQMVPRELIVNCTAWETNLPNEFEITSLKLDLQWLRSLEKFLVYV